VMLVAGLCMVLFALRLVADPSVRSAALFGVAAGTGWWSSPQIIYVAAPVGGWLLFRLVRDHRNRLVPVVLTASACAILAALPWFYTTIDDPLGALRSPNTAPDMTVLDRLRLFRRFAFPTALGAKVPIRLTWYGGMLGRVGFVAALVMLVAGFIALGRRGRVVQLVVVMYPFLFAAFPSSFYIGEPRYLTLLWPFVALLAARAIALVPTHVGRVAITVGLLATTLGGTLAFVDLARRTPRLLDVAPGDLEPLLAFLDAEDIPAVYADYWVASRIALESDLDTVASGLQVVRSERFEREARRRNSPYVLFTDSCYDVELRRHLDGNAIPYTATTIADWTVVQPATKVLPEQALPEWATARGDPVGTAC
jgi:hypothetical protein